MPAQRRVGRVTGAAIGRAWAAGSNERPSRSQYETARRGAVVKVGPGVLELPKLAEDVGPEIVDGPLVGLGLVHAELPVELPPGQLQGLLEPEEPVRQPQVEIEPERAALHRLQHVHVERDWAGDDLVEELLAELDRAHAPQNGLVGPLRVPPQVHAARNVIRDDVHASVGPVCQLNGALEQPLHLVVESGYVPAGAAATALDAELHHELAECRAEAQRSALRSDHFGADPRKQQARQVAVRQLRLSGPGEGQSPWTVGPGVLEAVARIRPGQRAEREQSHHEPGVGLTLAGRDQGVGLVVAVPVVDRLRRQRQRRRAPDVFPELLDAAGLGPFPLPALLACLAHRLGPPRSG